MMESELFIKGFIIGISMLFWFSGWLRSSARWYKNSVQVSGVSKQMTKSRKQLADT